GARAQVQSVLVRPYPTVIFGLATDDGCSPFTPEINNVTRGMPDTWFWDMGNGLTGTDSLPPIQPYFTPEDSVSVYNIRLIASNECGVDTLTEQLTVHPPDVDAFIGVDTLAGCQPWRFEPRSFSTPGAALAWEVTNPNGELVATGNGATPNFELTDVGLHRVILRAARCGEDADTIFVDVLPAPEVSFSTMPRICQDEELNLVNTSTGIAGGNWDFGNGMTSDQLNPMVTYDSVATYEISFTGFSALNGCPATTTTLVTVAPLPFVAIATTDTTGCGPFTTRLRNTAQNVGSLTYNWDFGDGTNASTESEPEHTYASAGTYLPRLTVTDVAGCSADTVFSRIIVHPDPVPAFTFVNNRFCAGNDSLRLNDASLGATALNWVLNGTEYDGTPPTLPLVQEGNALVQLTATNAFGCSATTSEEYAVLPSPQASLALSAPEACDGQSITFTSTATGSTDFLWSFGDATGGTASTILHTYATPGTYSVNLLATNQNGCPDDQLDTTITIHPNPAAAFTLTQPARCGTPTVVSFTNASTGALSYAWDFGDGATATSLSPNHEYTIFGQYNPQLIAISNFGCRDTTSQPLSVAGAPVAAFAPPPPLACGPYSLSLTAETTDALRYEWYLDDAFAPSIGQSFDTVLSELRSYDLRLIAIYDDDCRDTLTQTNLFTLEARPIADFDFTVDVLANRLGDVRFTSRSIGGNELYWDLGDGTTSTASDFLHEYRINRDIFVTHAATTRYDQGLVCSDTIVKSVEPEWITRFFVPNAVSPESGPPEVREWGAKGFGVAEYRLAVFSPYGQTVFATSELEDSQPVGRWRATLPGSDELVLQGAYTWRATVTYVDGSTENLVGTVTVIR
ncbi:MAG: PKD domain-containing protein, partial [Bacteroidota bacterium]